MDLETASADFGTMDESVEADAFPDKHNEEFVEAEVINEGDIGAPEDLDVDTSAQPSENFETMDEAV